MSKKEKNLILDVLSNRLHDYKLGSRSGHPENKAMIKKLKSVIKKVRKN